MYIFRKSGEQSVPFGGDLKSEMQNFTQIYQVILK